VWVIWARGVVVSRWKLRGEVGLGEGEGEGMRERRRISPGPRRMVYWKGVVSSIC
jgi:hypothetical protein